MDLTTIVANMRGESITNGWDVVCAMSAAKLTELFEAKYDSANHGGLVYHIEAKGEDSIPIYDGFGLVEMDLKIRSPLISFIPNDDDKIRLTMRIIEGYAQALNSDGSPHEPIEDNLQEFCTQDKIEDEPYIDVIVPLQGLRGEVGSGKEGEDVIVNFSDESGNYYIQTAYETDEIKGFTIEGIQKYFQENVGGEDYSYSLGTLIYEDNPDLINLTPTSFRFATVSEELGDGTSPVGSLQLFINVKGGRGEDGIQLDLNKIVDPIPDGFSTALIISSRVLMSVGICPSLEQISPNATVESVKPTLNGGGEDLAGLWKLRCTGGSLDLGVPGTDIDGWVVAGGDLRGVTCPDRVVVPLAGLTLEEDQAFGMNIDHPEVSIIRYPYDQEEFSGGSSGTHTVRSYVDLHFRCNGSYSSTISGDEVLFNKETVSANVRYDNDENGKGTSKRGDDICDAVDYRFKTKYEDLIQVDLKGISTFAVSNLLFPEDHVIEFGVMDDGTVLPEQPGEDDLHAVSIPGDMLIVGRVKPLN